MVAHSKNNDCMIMGGTIHTMDRQRQRVDAVVIQNGRIVYVGDVTGARKHSGRHLETIDLKGKTAFPGFIECHGHAVVVGRWLSQREVNCINFRSIGEIIAALREKEADTSPGEWVLGFNYDESKLAEKRHPTRYDLDQVSRDKPIALRHFTLHHAVANSEALRIAGITANTQFPTDGEIVRDGSGEPTGLLLEFASGLIQKHIPAYTVDDICGHLLEAAHMYLSSGVTSVQEAGLGLFSGIDEILAIEKVISLGGMPIRFGAAIYYPLWKELKAGAGPGFEWGADPEWVRPFAVKLFQDGSLFYTAAMSTPVRRHTRPGDQYLFHSQQELDEMVIDAHTKGWQIWTHANGDLAIQEVLDAYDRALSINPRKDHRHRIEHCPFPNDAQLDRMAALGVLPSFFPAHIYHWGDDHIDNFGPEKAAHMYPMASALKRGLEFGMHNDSPFTPMEPMVQVSAAVTRKSRNGELLGPAQAISIDQALRALTLGNAYLAFEEDVKGSLEEGKMGDVTILEADPYKVGPDEIKEIQVAMTILNGKVVFAR